MYIKDTSNKYLATPTITGADGREVELRNSGTYIQWRYPDTDWQNLVLVSSLSGANGKQVEFSVDASYIKWRYVGELTWNNLVALSTITGPKGDTGARFTPSVNASGDLSWTNNGGLSNPATVNIKGPIGVTGDAGTSAYVWIKWSAAQPTQDADMKDTADAYIGIYGGDSSSAPTEYTSYTWYQYKGAKGDQGTPGTGNNWYSGSAITGTSTTPTAYTTGITLAQVGDIYLNTGSLPDTGRVYSCTTGGNAATALWVYQGLLRGADGVDGADGNDGADGRGVASFVLTSGNHAAGSTDTYTLTLTDETTVEVPVYNGADGLGSGDMLASVYADSAGVVKDSTKFGGQLPAYYLTASQKGTANGLAELDDGGKVPSSQLPSYVDDVSEYASFGSFPATGESGKIYIATDTNLSYRWTGSGYAEISPSIALGETSATAYRGDRGKTAYDHSQTTGNPHGTDAADITSLGALATKNTVSATEIDSNAVTTTKILDANVTSAKLANMAAYTLKGRNSGTTGVPGDVTMLDVAEYSLAQGTTVTSVADAEYIPVSVSSTSLKKITWANVIAAIRTALFSTVNGIAKLNGSGGVSAAAAGTDFALPGLLVGSLSLPTSGYSGTGPYTKTFTVTGATTDASKRYLLIPDWSSTAATRALEKTAWNLVDDYAITSVNVLTITVTAVPATAVSFSLKEVV